ncbi:ThuA domain-containing protein [Zhongshania sp.]|uniref:ThuA domain-containing protein n=1 Tax=Zhongshania sp. TaxID=1971902 RepID=UPI00356939B4
MNWKRNLKIGGLGFLLVTLGLLSFGYLKLKETGLIPRKDYETLTPVFSVMSRPAVLVLNKTNGFIHRDGIPAADAMLKRIAKSQGWDVFITNNAASHNADMLKQFDLVVWNNVSGDVLTIAQRRALKIWLEQGGGWVGLHASGGDFSYDWAWFVNTLIGTQFIGHTLNPQFQDADVYIADSESPITAHLSSPWRIANEEWYAFASNPRDKGYEILLALDESSYITKGENWMGINDHMDGEHPIVWRHSLGRGRVFYSAIGHQAATYGNPEYQLLISKAMNWARRRRD